MSDVTKVAIAGLGTVGCGTVKLLEDQAGLIAARCGRRVQVVAVSARNRGKTRDVDINALTSGSTIRWPWPARRTRISLWNSSAALTVIAKASVEAALCQRQARGNGQQGPPGASWHVRWDGRPKVQGLGLAYEAAVAGGIPDHKNHARRPFGERHFTRVYGIMNGTCNYILSEHARQRP